MAIDAVNEVNGVKQEDTVLAAEVACRWDRAGNSLAVGVDSNHTADLVDLLGVDTAAHHIAGAGIGLVVRGVDSIHTADPADHLGVGNMPVVLGKLQVLPEIQVEVGEDNIEEVDHRPVGDEVRSWGGNVAFTNGGGVGATGGARNEANLSTSFCS